MPPLKEVAGPVPDSSHGAEDAENAGSIAGYSPVSSHAAPLDRLSAALSAEGS